MSYPIIIVRTVLAVILGGVIGLERQSKHRPAGFRTHILVCLGSATIMILSELMFIKYNAGYGLAYDPARMAAQVVSGIGFLGAGTIINYQSNVKGLTTAASLWAVAAIGLAVGAGFYSLAITVTALIYATLLAFNKISLKMDKQGNVLEMKIALVNKPETLGEINLLLAKNDAKILDMVFINPTSILDDGTKDEDVITIRIVTLLTESASFADLMNSIREITGIVDVSRI